jgi:hypothetical protein
MMWAQESVNWFIGLTNLGGGFVLAAVVLLLHRDSLKAFREELATERKMNNDNVKCLLDAILHHHEEAVERFSRLERLLSDHTKK